MTHSLAAIALLTAFVVDRAFGEPATRWHPVGWMGRYLGWIGGRIAPREPQPERDLRSFWSGALAWWGGALLVLVAGLLLQELAGALGVAGAVVAGIALKTMLSWRMLHDEVRDVEIALGQSLDSGRRQLGRLVSREVMRLDELQVCARARSNRWPRT